MAAPAYIECELSVRPPRVATLVPVASEPGDLTWMTRMTRMLEDYSRAWGGEGNIIVPWDPSERIRPEFWWPLRSFDPDYVTHFSPSANEIRLRDPQEYERWVDETVTATAERNGRAPDEVRAMLAGQFPPERDVDFGTGWGATMPLGLNGDEVRRQLSPLTVREHALLGSFQAGGVPPDPLVDLAEFFRKSDLWVFEGLDDLDARLALLAKSRVGAFAPDFQASLRPPDHSVATVAVADEHVDALIQLAWYGSSNQDYITSGKPRWGGWRQPDWAEYPTLAKTPFALGLAGCAWFIPGGGNMPGGKPFVYVFGRTADDYCLAQCLDRLYSQAAWVPVDSWSDQDSLGSAMLRRLQADVPEMTEHRPVWLTSMSLDDAELGALRASLAAEEGEESPGKPVEIVAAADLVDPGWKPLRICDVEHFADDQVEPFIDGVLAGRLKSPLPSAVPDLGDQISWQVDVVYRKNELPNRSALSEGLKDGASWECWLRSAFGGVSYRSDKMGLVRGGTPLQNRIARPRLRLPDAMELFRSLLPDGYSCRLSDKGHYTEQMLRLWGDLDSLALDMASGSAAALMNAFVARRQFAAGRSYELDGRLYVNLSGLAEATGEDPEVVRLLVDRLQQIGVLRPGRVLTCPRCRSTGWHSVDSAGQMFTCQRCSSATLVTSPVWKPRGGPEPGIYYGLAEVVFQAILNGGRLPVLALKKLKDDAASMLYSPEMGIWQPGQDRPLMEVDIWAVRDGRVLLGEVRSVDRVRHNRMHAKLTPDDCEKLASAAHLATADEVLLATNAVAFSKEWVKRLNGALARKANAGPVPHVRVIDNLG